MHAYYSDVFVLPLPTHHRFPMAKYRMLRDRLEAECPSIRLHEAPPATDGELALAHTPDYISSIVEGTASEAQMREIGFPWSERMVERARRSVGATIAAARTALRDGVAANLAGGTHHASAERGGGYCVFNDVAVAARLMQAEWHRRPHGDARGGPNGSLNGSANGSANGGPHGGPRRMLRVLVIDLDVHQGNGTASIFRDDPSVFTLSMHGARNFPFRKVAGDLDVDLPDGCADAAYLEALEAALAEVWHRHGAALPGLAFYLAGADPHEGDRLGRLKLTTAGLAERDRRVFDALGARGIPVAVSMAGGYGHRIEDTVEVQLGTLRAALAHGQRHRQPRAQHGTADPAAPAADRQAPIAGKA
jgi:acetoin utilization deacetylase AcuC-like enzyme